ncbi:MAG: S-layer homology domain-containing protein [Ruminiclostridium sp.]|nr:S-layer homology domain-containing protein [Ruminiclostridium sp.]
MAKKFNFKRILSLVMAFTMATSLLPMGAMATGSDGESQAPAATTSIGTKTATPDAVNNKYQVEIAVPGIDGVKTHDEVIVMVDGSTSVDSEWPAMSDAVMQIGRDFLDGSGNTQLTLMAFGISPTVVKEHITSCEELEDLLDQYQGDLLYGRSGTNCSAAFDGIIEYITKHDDTLDESYVVYISDGRVNLNNTSYVWQDCVANKLPASYAADAAVEEILGIGDGAAPSDAYEEVFGDKAETLAEFATAFFDAVDTNDDTAKAAAINAMYAIVNEETDSNITKAQLWASLVFEEVFAYVGLTETTEYPMHVVEKAFMDHKNAKNTNCQEAFYYTAVSLDDNYNHTENGKACAVTAGKAAAEVADKIFLVRYNPDNRSVWMDNVNSENVTLVDAGSIGNVSEEIKESVAEYVITPFNNVVVTDYMSKWVNLDTNSLKIVDNSTDEVIWTVDGWVEGITPPTAKTPVVVEEVADTEYEAGGDDVIGNSNGTIYKLTWNVKDGAMLRSDNYSLVYDVTVDTKETGFEYGTNYPANGNTTLKYENENGDAQENSIEVPDVVMYSVTYEYTGDIPASAPDLPTGGSYLPGASVTVADKPSLDGYTFSGWDSSDLENGKMPAKNVVITGSWDKIAPPTPTDPEQKIPVDKTATPLNEDDQTNVTLSVPGSIEGNIDVVFILGGGMTANMETIESAINVFKPAMESGKATVRMGLISLEKGKEIILDLNSDEAVLDPATYVDFVTAKFDSINDLPYGTTNLHSQLVEAQKMLAKETKAKAENKYVFVLATGRTYWFDDANGEQATIVNKLNDTYYWGNYLWQSQRGRHTSLYMLPDRYNDSYEAFFGDIEKWVADDGDKYVYTPHFDVNDYSAYVTWEQNNNKDLKDLGVAGSRFGNGIVNPKPTAENFITGTPAGASSDTHPSDALNYERAQYECVQVWKALVANGYNCYSICSESPNYQNGSEYIKQGAKYTGTSTTQVGHSFMNYLATLAGQKEAPTVWDYERDAEGNMLSTKTVLQENFFDSVRDDLLYTTSKGSTVEDYIGKNENGNYEFIEKAEYIKLTVGGVDYTTAQTENTDEGSKYTFTAPGATKPTFWLDYYYGDGETTERFVWTFGENVSTENRASLTYKLQLTGKAKDDGTYIVPTNNSATLYPMDSNGKIGDPQTFPVPEVKYTVETETPAVEKYTVTYEYTGTVPSGAPALPGTASYAEGETVTVAANPTLNGWEFSGWDKTGSFTMPAVNVVIKGSWTQISTGGNGGGHHISDTDIPLAPIPEVFTSDHFAYIIGYPKDYQTGKWTDIQERMPVMPQGNITRAEVATIFFRLLTEDVRTYNMELVDGNNDFSDVNKGQWFNNAISTMANMGIVNGYPDGTFRPNGKITRAEFAAIAARFSSVTDTTGAYFTDIAGHWAEDEIYRATNSGWIKGYEDNTFKPNQLITRAEAMTLVNRVLHRLPETVDDLHDDMLKWVDNMDTSKWYYLAVQEATNSHDYTRDPSNIDYETWTKMREARDWSELEY